MTSTGSTEAPTGSPQATARVVAVVSDLFFVARIREVARLAGVPLVFARSADEINATLAAGARLVLLDLTGRHVRLSSSWRSRPAVLVFLRYFGCPMCQEHVVNLRNDQDRFRGAASIVLVGQGDPEEGAAFVGRKRVPFDCLIDPDRSMYRAYGLPRGTATQVFGFTAVTSVVRATLRPETRHGTLHGGSLMQMPGTFVVDVAGIVRLAHRNRTIADNPPNDVLLAALEGLDPPSDMGRTNVDGL